MIEEKRKSLHPISETLCEAYSYLYDRKEVSFPLYEENINKVDSIVKTVNGIWFGVERFKTAEEKAAAYFCFIIKDHPVVDGNKRLATLWLQVFCDANKIRIDVSEDIITLDVLAVSVEASKVYSMQKLIEMCKTILF